MSAVLRLTWILYRILVKCILSSILQRGDDDWLLCTTSTRAARAAGTTEATTAAAASTIADPATGTIPGIRAASK